MTKDTRVLYSWKYEDTKHRSPVWYVAALSIVIGIIIWGFLTRQYGLSIMMMLAGGFFYFLENNSEDEVEVELTELGIKVLGHFYDYARINKYSLVYSGDQAVQLRLQMNKRGISIINLNLDNTIAQEIRPILSGYVEESEKQEVTLGEKIIHLLKL